MSDLPNGWALVTLADVGDWGSGGTPRTTEPRYYEGDIPWVRSGDLPDGPISEHSICISEEAVANSAAKWVPENAVLIAMYGATIGKLGLTTYPVTTNQAVATCRCSDAVLPLFLFWLLRRMRPDLIEMGQGGAQPNISQQLLKKLEIALPPLAEQRCIVAKLEQVMARTARARAELARIPALIAHHKRSLYAAAFSGQWARSKWSWERADAACDRVQSGGTPKEGFADDGVPFLKVYNIVDQRIDFAYRAQFVTSEIHTRALKKSIARPGDVLMNIVGPPLGKVAVIPDAYPEWNINQALTLFRPSERVSSAWLYHFLCSGISVRSVINETRGMVGQVNISLSQCRAFELPTPPLDEQRDIVRRLESAFAWLDKVAHEHAQATRLLDHLDQALLAKAFRGELVPQDPTDEPAATLLARIRAEREGAAPATRKRKARG